MFRQWQMIIIFHFLISSAVCTLLEFLALNIDQEIINKLELINLYKQNLNISEQYLEKFIEEFQAGEADEDLNLNNTQLIMKYGYSVEEHTVMTSDGYALSIIRIPRNGPPVFLMHGLFGSSDDWVDGPPDTSVAFYLAARNFDVWMGNARGTKKFKENEKIPKEKFWNFSWHEIGVHDVPSMIDYILEKTNQKSLIYIGHSQGTTAFYVMCSLRPEYNDKVRLMISLSTVAWSSHMKSPFLQMLAPKYDEVYNFLKSIDLYEFTEDGTILQFFQRVVCENMETVDIVCKNFLFSFIGFSSQTPIRRLPVLFNHFPAPASVKQAVHYLQLIKSGQFQLFDYGSQNILIYGSSEPPSYPVENITAPVAIFLSDGDWLSSRTDVAILQSKLPNLIDFYEIPIKDYNHFDFLLAKINKSILLPKLLTLVQKYTKS